MEQRRRRRTRSRGAETVVTEAPSEPVMKTVVLKSPSIERPPMRTSQSEDDLARAAARAAEILDDDSMLTSGEDKYYVDQSVIPDGWVYQWKRNTVYNKEDPQYRTVIDRGGWTNVPTERHPELMPPGSPDKHIHLDGLMLMERPKAVDDKVRARDQLAARNQVRAKEEQLASAPPGTFERGTHQGAPVKVNKGYSPVDIPL